MFKSISTKVIAAALLASTLGLATSGSAQAGYHGGHGRAWGAAGAVGLGLGVLGAIAATNAYAAPVDDEVEVRRVCRMERQFNDYGEYVGRARICRTVAY